MSKLTNLNHISNALTGNQLQTSRYHLDVTEKESVTFSLSYEDLSATTSSSSLAALLERDKSSDCGQDSHSSDMYVDGGALHVPLAPLVLVSW